MRALPLMHTETALARTFLVLAYAVVSSLVHRRYVVPALILGGWWGMPGCRG